jgi:hypothetical protein
VQVGVNAGRRTQKDGVDEHVAGYFFTPGQGVVEEVPQDDLERHNDGHSSYESD